MYRFCISIITALLCLASTAIAADKESPLLSFIAGDYVIIGKAPDNGPTYSGHGRIEKKGNKLTLIRKVNGKQSMAEGVVAVPSPPGEGEAVRFTWTEHGLRAMTCLVSGDLDNYARLTCTWIVPKQKHKEPGLEALFPTAAWP